MQPPGRSNPLRHGLGVGGIRDITNLEAEFQNLDQNKPPAAAAAAVHPLVITSTGFHGAERKRLASLAQALGGSYAADLVAGTTTHLVCKRLIDAVGGPKHTAALRWGVAVVSAAWLEDSAAAGHVQPEASYKDDPLAAWQSSPWPAPSSQAAPHSKATHGHQYTRATLQQQQQTPDSSTDGSQQVGIPHLFLPAAPISSTLEGSAAGGLQTNPFSFTQLPAAAHSSSPPGMPIRGTLWAPTAAAAAAAAGAASSGIGEGGSCSASGQAAGNPWSKPAMQHSSSSNAHTHQLTQLQKQRSCGRDGSNHVGMATLEGDDVWVPETQADWGEMLEGPELGPLSMGGAAAATATAAPQQACSREEGGSAMEEEQQQPEQQQSVAPPNSATKVSLMPQPCSDAAAETAEPPTTAATVCKAGLGKLQQPQQPTAPASSHAAAAAAAAAVAPATQSQQCSEETSSSATTHLSRLRRLRRRAPMPAASPDSPSKCHQAGDSELEDSGCSEAEEEGTAGSRSMNEHCEQTEGHHVPKGSLAAGAGQRGLPTVTCPHLGMQATPGQQLVTPGCSVSGSSWPGATPASSATTSSSLPITRLSFSGLVGGSGSSSKDTVRQQQQHVVSQDGCPSSSTSSSNGRSRGSAGRSLSLSRTSAALAAAAAARPADIEALRQEQQRQRAARKAAAAGSAGGGAALEPSQGLYGGSGDLGGLQQSGGNGDGGQEEVVADSDELEDEVSSVDQEPPQQQQQQQQREDGTCESPATQAGGPPQPGPGSAQLPASAVSFITTRRCGGGRGGRGGKADEAPEAAPEGRQHPGSPCDSPAASASAAGVPAAGQLDASGATSGTAAAACHAEDSSQLQEADTTTPPAAAGQTQVQRVGTAQAAAGAAVLAAQLGGRLPHLGPAAAAAPEGVLALKLAARPPRGSTAKEHHGLRSSKQLVYAEQVQVPWARTTLSTKERSRCVICQQPPPPGAPAPAKPLTTYVAEPLAFYQLVATGEWWMEGHRFYSAKDLRALSGAAGAGEAVLPADFHAGCELLRGLQHTHLPLSAVKGEVKLARLRKAPAPGSAKGAGGLYWRYQLDVLTCRVLLEGGRGGGGEVEASGAGGKEAPSTCSTVQGGGG